MRQAVIIITKRASIVFEAILVIFLLLFPGCTESGGINPYTFLNTIDSVDHTQFFIDAYETFQAVGTGNTTTSQENQTQDQHIMSNGQSMPGMSM
jgi:hypothetical protein